MIYAWSADGTDPADHDSVMYHMSNRGTQGVIFVEENEVVSDFGNAESVTFLANDVSCITTPCLPVYACYCLNFLIMQCIVQYCSSSTHHSLPI